MRLLGGAQQATPAWLVFRCTEAVLQFMGGLGRHVGTTDQGQMGCRQWA